MYLDESPEIKQLTEKQFPGFGIVDGILLNKGQWGVVVLSKNKWERSGLIIKKENEQWVTKTKLELIIPYRIYPDIPRTVVDTANRTIVKLVE